MRNVYVVSERLIRKAYHAEQIELENIVKVFDDYHKAINYICDTIRSDHNRISDRDDQTGFYRYVPNPDSFVEGWYIYSFVYEIEKYYESKSYKFRSYRVE